MSKKKPLTEKDSGTFVYNCRNCDWSGEELDFSRLGQGFCPKCSHIFKGCFSNEITATGRPAGRNIDGPEDLFKALKLAEERKDIGVRKEQVAVAIAKYLPCRQAFHRKHFARQIAGMPHDNTTASLGYFSFKLLLGKGATEEEKRLLEMVSEMI